MGTWNYITAIEIGSSRISGTVGMATYDGMKIVAYASEPVDGFISKGVIRNVDAASTSLSNIVNRLESQLGGKVTIEKAYITIGGLSVHSIKSTVKRNFDEYKKVTTEIIDSMAVENEKEFAVPAGFQKVQVIPLEYLLDGNANVSPTGFHARTIECSYLNIVINEQFMKQMCESFEMARIEIADSFCAAKIEADILLSKENKRGCALVNIGSDTTTVSIYSNELLRKLVVIPMGGETITKDICAERISREEAEQIKISKGYNSANGEGLPFSLETLNKIIGARIQEILLNVKHQIEISGEPVQKILFTGGTAKIKNLKMLLDEHLSGYTTQIITEPSLNCFSDSSLYLADGAITPTLFGLLSTGKENCCKEVMPKENTQPVQQNLFGEETETEIPADESKETAKKEQPETKKEEKEGAKKTEKVKKKPVWQQKLIDMFADFKDNMSEEEEEEGDDD